MKLNEIVDQIIRSIDGLVRTDDSKVSERALEAKIPQWKQDALLIIFNGAKGTRDTRASRSNVSINPLNYYQVTWTYNASIQVAGASFRLFEIEPPVQLNDTHNGCIFVGDQLTGTEFTQLRYPSTQSVAKNAGLIDVDEVFYNITGTKMKVWGNIQVNTVFMDYIPVDVMNISTFNPVTMEYPASQDVLSLIFKLAFSELVPQSVRPADMINDSAPIQGGGRG